ncbi:MAG TPA: thiamine diphosphokinase [Firmicutes bacterium]|nr:thiamine diphosphokinase [Bacillota bacterium]
MIVNIVCGGPIKKLDLTYFEAANVYNIGVDRGSIQLLQQGITPHACIGDFDSITKDELEYVMAHCKDVRVLKPEKDETDTEVAIEYAVSLNCDEIRLFGTLGGRFDHTMANLKLLARFASSLVKLTLYDEQNTVTILNPGHYVFDRLPYVYLSFFAYEQDVTGLTFKNLKYPLQNYHLKQDDIRCVSNEMLDEVFEIKFDSGQLLMINSHD